MKKVLQVGDMLGINQQRKKYLCFVKCVGNRNRKCSELPNDNGRLKKKEGIEPLGKYILWPLTA